MSSSLILESSYGTRVLAIKLMNACVELISLSEYRQEKISSTADQIVIHMKKLPIYFILLTC